MRIEIRGRNTDVTDQVREHAADRFKRVARQVSDLATLELELLEERNPAIADGHVAEATLHLKGTTLRAREASPDTMTSINRLAEDMGRQVKRHGEKRRKRRETRRLLGRWKSQQAPPEGA